MGVEIWSDKDQVSDMTILMSGFIDNLDKVINSERPMAVWLVIVFVVVCSPHQSPRCGVSRFRSALSVTIPLSVWSTSISPAH